MNNYYVYFSIDFILGRTMSVGYFGYLLIEYLLDTVTQPGKIIDVLQNPLYDRVDRAIKIKLENFDKSCFSKRHGNVVIHIMFFWHYYWSIVFATECTYHCKTISIPKRSHFQYDILVLNQEILKLLGNYGLSGNVISIVMITVHEELSIICQIKKHFHSNKKTSF